MMIPNTGNTCNRSTSCGYGALFPITEPPVLTSGSYSVLFLSACPLHAVRMRIMISIIREYAVQCHSQLYVEYVKTVKRKRRGNNQKQNLWETCYFYEIMLKRRSGNDEEIIKSRIFGRRATSTNCKCRRRQ